MKGRAGRTAEACASLPEEAAAFVEGIAGRMGAGRRIAEDVRRELARHFEDALDGVADSREGAAVIQDEVRDFGDEELLSLLIRRGKRRCEKGHPSTLLGMAMAGGLILSAIAMGGDFGIFFYVPGLLLAMGFILGVTLAVHGAQALRHALWAARSALLEVDPESINKHDAAVLRGMVQRGRIAASGGFLLGLIMTLAYAHRIDVVGAGMSMAILTPLWACLLSEGLLRPLACRVEALCRLSELAVPECGTSVKGEKS